MRVPGCQVTSHTSMFLPRTGSHTEGKSQEQIWEPSLSWQFQNSVSLTQLKELESCLLTYLSLCNCCVHILCPRDRWLIPICYLSGREEANPISGTEDSPSDKCWTVPFSIIHSTNKGCEDNLECGVAVKLYYALDWGLNHSTESYLSVQLEEKHENVTDETLCLPSWFF